MLKLAIFEPDQRTLDSLDSEKYDFYKELYQSDESFKCTSFLLNADKSEFKEIFDQYIFLPIKTSSFKSVKAYLKNIPLKASIIFHLDGQFIFQTKFWKDLSFDIKNRNVKFVVASKSHQKLVQTMLVNINEVFHLPLSLTKKLSLSAFENDKIETFRNELGVNSDEIVFLYHGPITRQSNLLELTRLVIKLRTLLNLKIHLWVYGRFDDIAVPLLGKTQLNYEYFQQWQMIVDSLDAQSFVRYFGEQEDVNEKLVIDSSDWGVFPTSIDSEDFNFSALKLLSMGLPLVLSEWGSHFEFNFPDYLKHVSLVKDSPFHQVNLNNCAKILISLVQENNKLSQDQRTSLKQDVIAQYDKLASRDQLSAIFNANFNFTQFSEDFIKVEKSFDQNPYAPFVDVSTFGSYNLQFKTIYESYYSNH